MKELRRRYLDCASQVDPGFDGDIVRGLQECPLQQEGKEQKHGQDVGIAKELLGRDKVNPEKLCLWEREGQVAVAVRKVTPSAHATGLCLDYCRNLRVCEACAIFGK